MAFFQQVGQARVALRKESVDRNSLTFILFANFSASLSARRAWIEISTITIMRPPSCVALRKESVDRNMASPMRMIVGKGRSPQGERG